MKFTVATTHEFTVNVTIRTPQLSAAVDILGMLIEASIVPALTRIEETMAKSFAKLMEEVRTATQEIKDHRTTADAAEVQEDTDAAARDEANAAKIAELEARIEAGNLNEAQEAEAVAALAELRAAAGLPESTPEPEPPAA